MYSSKVRHSITGTHRKLLLLFMGAEIRCEKERKAFFKKLSKPFVSYEDSLDRIVRLGDFYEYSNKYKEDRAKVEVLLDTFTESLGSPPSAN